MELPIHPNELAKKGMLRFLHETYPDDYKDLGEAVFSLQFWAIWDGKQDKLESAYHKARAIAQPLLDGASHLGQLRRMADSARTYLMWKFEKNNLRAVMPMEYESIEEVLNAIMDNTSPDSGTRYELAGLIKYVLPAMEQQGIPANEAFGIAENHTKARRAIRAVKEAEMLPPAEQKERLHEIVTGINSPSSVLDFVKDIYGAPDIIDAITVLIPELYSDEYKEWIIIKPRDRVEAMAVRTRLRRLVEEVGQTTIFALAENIKEIVLGFHEDYIDPSPNIQLDNKYRPMFTFQKEKKNEH